MRLDVEEEDAWYGVNAGADDEAVVAVHGPKRALLAWLMGRPPETAWSRPCPRAAAARFPRSPSGAEMRTLR